MDFPYKAEYAKSGRAGCRGCKTSIGQGDLRLAVMVQNPKFDGKTPQWYHFPCFFKKQRPKTTDDIQHYESLRVADQDKIKANIGVATAIIVPEKGKKGKKRAAGDNALQNAALKDFKVEYAKSNRSTCQGCEQKIIKDEVRVSKKDFDTEVGKKYGGQDMWHHLTCFAQVRSELGFFESGDKLPGFKSLKADDQKEVKTNIPAIKQEDVPEIKKVKKEEDDPTEKEYRAQNKIMFKYRDHLSDQLEPKELAELLEYNNQAVPKGKDRMLDRLADIMTFGSLAPCEKCKGGQLVFNKIGYTCTGDLTEWTKCPNVVKEPKRVPFKVPKEYAKEYTFLKTYKYKPCTRVVKEVNPTNGVKKEEAEDSEPKVKRALPPLYDMEFVIVGNPPKGKDAIKKLVASLGGKVATKVRENVIAIISTQEEVEKHGVRMQEAESNQIHVVPDDFLDEAKDNTGKIPDLIIKKSICNWGSDPTVRLPPEPSTSKSLKSKSKSIYTKSMPSKVKLKVKGGGAVDPDSGLEDVAHVYQDGSIKYNVVLGVTDIQTKKNSYYKLQVLKGDKSDRYWLFRSWGRIGTTIGDFKVEPLSLYEAKQKFVSLYEEKTGNLWQNHGSFVKQPGKMYPIDIDYGGEDDNALAIVEMESKLPKPVQDLMKIIFDVNTMKKLMLEFELDTEKMPLGKLSKAQIHKALGVLSELQRLIETNADRTLLMDASNRFYTFIPHSFGVDDPPVISDMEVIKEKTEVLNNLMEMEIAYNLMKSSGDEHTVDSYYSQLNTEIEVLDPNAEEFAIIREYVINTHAKTHSNYHIDIEEVFIVKRQGEEKRFKPFQKLHNRKLLWHGSRVTNFAGILSQGLRIAPPEAPVTGYMFGKGIYFADMVSKSANYCCTGPLNPTGLILLCSVALGNMFENKHANYIEKLPKGMHSCKGLGRTEPDPSYIKKIKDVDVPLGKGIAAATDSSLLYNEYIVYDIAQVQVNYLLKLNFKYKY